MRRFEQTNNGFKCIYELATDNELNFAGTFVKVYLGKVRIAKRYFPNTEKVTMEKFIEALIDAGCKEIIK